MGLSNYPSPAEGVLPILVMNTLISVSILKKLLMPFLQLLRAITNNETTQPNSPYRVRGIKGISVTQFKYMCDSNKTEGCNSNSGNSKIALEGRTRIEFCVFCLCNFKEEEDVSELSCKHFFHRDCLDKWFGNHHSTCPLCRSVHKG